MRFRGKFLLVNLMLILLALEIKTFFDKGGVNNDLAYTLFKILFVSLACLTFANFEEFGRVVLGGLERAITPCKAQR